MTYFENFIARNFSSNSSFKAGMLKLALFGFALLLVAMLFAASYGLDLSAGFF
jgi:hypothetical protein